MTMSRTCLTHLWLWAEWSTLFNYNTHLVPQSVSKASGLFNTVTTLVCFDWITFFPSLISASTVPHCRAQSWVNTHSKFCSHHNFYWSWMDKSPCGRSQQQGCCCRWGRGCRRWQSRWRGSGDTAARPAGGIPRPPHTSCNPQPEQSPQPTWHSYSPTSHLGQWRVHGCSGRLCHPIHR